MVPIFFFWGGHPITTAIKRQYFNSTTTGSADSGRKKARMQCLQCNVNVVSFSVGDSCTQAGVFSSSLQCCDGVVRPRYRGSSTSFFIFRPILCVNYITNFHVSKTKLQLLITHKQIYTLVLFVRLHIDSVLKECQCTNLRFLLRHPYIGLLRDGPYPTPAAHKTAVYRRIVNGDIAHQKQQIGGSQNA